MYRPNFVESSVDRYLEECDENEAYSEKCQEWVDEQIKELMEIVEGGMACIDLPNAIGKHTSITIDEILIDNYSERFYTCFGCMLHSDDADHRERFGREYMMAHLEECLGSLLFDVSDQHVVRD